MEKVKATGRSYMFRCGIHLYVTLSVVCSLISYVCSQYAPNSPTRFSNTGSIAYIWVLSENVCCCSVRHWTCIWKNEYSWCYHLSWPVVVTAFVYSQVIEMLYFIGKGTGQVTTRTKKVTIWTNAARRFSILCLFSSWSLYALFPSLCCINKLKWKVWCISSVQSFHANHCDLVTSRPTLVSLSEFSIALSLL